MSHMHEEMEMGRELDQVLRTGIMGLAQMIEGMQRRAAGRDQAATQDLRQAIAALQQRPAAVEAGGDDVAVARRWVQSAHDVARNPRDEHAAAQAAIAAEQLRRRGTDPVAQLTDALTDRAANRADADRARQAGASVAPVVLPAGEANPDRGVAPSKAQTPQEAEHRRQAWAAARATHGEGIDPATAEKAWTALPQREQWDRFWKEYDTEAVRTIGTPETAESGRGVEVRQDPTAPAEAASATAVTQSPPAAEQDSTSVAAERGMAPSKAPTAEEAEHRRRAWATAQQEFAATLPEGTSRAETRKAWDGLDWQDKGLLYWKAYDSPTTQLAAPAAGASAGGAVSRERVLELNERAAQWFTTNAGPGSEGREYLESRLGAGLVDQGQWQVGYAPSGWTNLTGHLRAGGASNDEIVAAGLGVRSSRGNVIDVFRDRAMIGIRDQAGATVGFVGRDLSGDPRAPKYINTTATPAFSKGEHLLGLHEAPAGADLVRVEGPFDAIAVTRAGEGRVAGVAALGTALTDQQAQLLVDHAGQASVLLGLDNDAGGRDATEEDYWRLAERGVDPRLLVLPPGQDPAQLWKEQPDTLRTLLATSSVAPSAALVVVERTVEDLQDGLRDGRPEARELLAATQDQLAVTVPEADRDQVRAYGQQLVDQLRDRADDAEQDAGAFDGRERQADSDADRERETPVQTARDLDRAQAAHAQASTSDADVDRFTAAAQEASAAQGSGPRVPGPYDRATETVIGQLPDEARRARIVSSYGYTRSTSSMLTDASGAGVGQQAKKTQLPQNTGRNRNRTK